MPVNETVVARNMLDNITVIGSETNARQFVQWAAKGDPSGDDVQFVPAELANTAGFRKALARKILVLDEDETDATVKEALDKQLAAFEKRQAGINKAAEEAIERTDSRDTVTKFCVGPNSRDNGVCEQPVAVLEKTQNASAPLCAQHEHLRADYVPQELVDNGSSSVQWVRVSIEARKKS